MVRALKNNNIVWILYALFAISCIVFLLIGEKGDAVLFFSESRHRSLDLFFRFMSYIVEAWVFIGLAIIYAFFDYRNSIKLGLAGILALIFSAGLKKLFAMPRPLLYLRENGKIAELSEISGYVSIADFTSFPSGHATAAFALFFTLIFIIKSKLAKLILCLLAILAALSRVYLANHFIQDVLAGSMLGILLAIVISVAIDSLKLPEFELYTKNKA